MWYAACNKNIDEVKKALWIELISYIVIKIEWVITYELLFVIGNVIKIRN